MTLNQLLIERSFEISDQLKCPIADNLEGVENCVLEGPPTGAELNWGSISGRVLISDASGEEIEYTLAIFGDYSFDLLSCTNVRIIQPTSEGTTSMLAANCNSTLFRTSQFWPRICPDGHVSSLMNVNHASLQIDVLGGWGVFLLFGGKVIGGRKIALNIH